MNLVLSDQRIERCNRDEKLFAPTFFDYIVRPMNAAEEAGL